MTSSWRSFSAALNFLSMPSSSPISSTARRRLVLPTMSRGLLLERASTLLRSRPPDESPPDVDLGVHIRLGSLRTARCGYTPAARDAFDRARLPAERLDRRAELLTALWALAATAVVRGIWSPQASSTTRRWRRRVMSRAGLPWPAGTWGSASSPTTGGSWPRLDAISRLRWPHGGTSARPHPSCTVRPRRRRRHHYRDRAPPTDIASLREPAHRGPPGHRPGRHPSHRARSSPHRHHPGSRNDRQLVVDRPAAIETAASHCGRPPMRTVTGRTVAPRALLSRAAARTRRADRSVEGSSALRYTDGDGRCGFRCGRWGALLAVAVPFPDPGQWLGRPPGEAAE
jgi:hypothetical protein